MLARHRRLVGASDEANTAAVGGRRRTNNSDVGSGRDRRRERMGTDSDSIVVPSAAPVLSREVYLWMDDSHVSGESVIPGEGLFLGAERTPDLLLADVVDRVFVPCEIVRPREDGIAGLACRRVDTLALVRPGLRVALQQSR